VVAGGRERGEVTEVAAPVGVRGLGEQVQAGALRRDRAGGAGARRGGDAKRALLGGCEVT